MSAASPDVALPFRRLSASHNPRAAFIFAVVGDDELTGDRGMIMGDAAGWELDRVDPVRYTPPHALVVATVKGFSNAYPGVIEEGTAPDAHQGRPENPAVRPDLVFFETTNDGAVFAVGSITRFGSLSYNMYENPVSRITDNVARAFVSDDWPAW
jgi:N,N-dimethylformamidase